MPPSQTHQHHVCEFPLAQRSTERRDLEKAGARESLEATASTWVLRCAQTQHSTQSPPSWAREHSWELPTACCTAGRGLGDPAARRQRQHTCTGKSRRKSSQGLSENRSQAGCILRTLVGFLCKEGGQSKKPITETQ